jgi:hypothetical protein
MALDRLFQRGDDLLRKRGRVEVEGFRYAPYSRAA